jgi:hypothetical protein
VGQGVAAHLDHLALYAGARGYPKRATPDPRQFGFLRGRARTVQALGWAWAPSRSYGREVLGLARQIGLWKPRAQPRGQTPVLRTGVSRRAPAPHFAEGLFH